MRKSEAQLLCEQLENQHGSEWDLTVLNLKTLGFRIPGNEHPFFVVGIPSEKTDQKEADRGKREVIKKKSEVVIWDNNEKSWSVHRTTYHRLRESQQQKENLYIFDTRTRSFVPARKFSLPTSSD